MKRWIILAVLVVAITTTATVAVQYLPDLPANSRSPGEVSFPAATAVAAGPKPLAVVEGDTTHHFGMAAQQAKIDHEWTIKNQGKGDLTLTQIPPACSCTVAAFENGKDTITLKPGVATKLHLTFHTNNYDGAYRKTASLVTNDPVHPNLEFAGEGTVRPSVVLYPPESTINYLEISSDQDDHRSSIALYSPDRPAIQITQLVSSRPGEIVVAHEPLKAEDCKVLKIGQGHRITINVLGTIPLGVFREEVVVKTDHPKQPEVRLTVTGKMVGPISASPERMRLVPVESQRGATSELVVTVRGLRPTRFEVEKKPEKFQVEIAPKDQSKQPGQYRLTVTVPPGLPSGLIMDDIVLKTDHPKAGMVKIPVDVAIKD
jgi:hypothetical protein